MQNRTNPLAWKGQFSPQFIDVLLKTYSSPGNHVLDPFVGSGTVIGECVRHQLSATGIEINPAAVILARVYAWATVTRQVRQEAITLVEQVAHEFINSGTAALSDAGEVLFRPQDLAKKIAEIGDPDVRGLAGSAFVLADPKWNSVDPGRLRVSVRRLRELLVGLPETRLPVSVIEGDARLVPLDSNTVDLVLTSPPYINVFNYHQQYRPAVEALGYDVLDAARSEIGSNRKHRMNRFLTVIQYCIDMAAVISEMRRVLRPSGRIIIVLGRESRVRGIPILNGDLFCSVAARAGGLIGIMRQERAFTNRFGERIVEDILHFEVNERASVEPKAARDIGREYLRSVVSLAGGDVRADIHAAIDQADEISSSRLYSSEPPARL